MGRDKIENEDLIKFGWQQDVWFHVSNLSSAHVYLRMDEGMTLKQIPPGHTHARKHTRTHAHTQARGSNHSNAYSRHGHFDRQAS